jgi:hypothetical protein
MTAEGDVIEQQPQAAPAQGAPGAAAAGKQAAQAQVAKSGASQPSAKDQMLKIGFSLDAGFPDFIGLNVNYRPFYFLRLHGGLTHNTVSPGVRLGASLIPFYFGITPALTAEVGHYFPGNANGIVQLLTNDSSFNNALLSDVGYDYANLHLGLEFGPPRRFTFFARLGLTYVQATVNNFSTSLAEATAGSGVTAKDPILRFTAPSIKSGFIIYFL